MNLVLYHNPRCSKSRQALALLQEQGLQPQLRLYLQDPLTAVELEQLLQQLDKQPAEVLRSGEAEYTELNLGRADVTPAEVIQALVAHPRLLERPILSNGTIAVIGRPPEQVLTII